MDFLQEAHRASPVFIFTTENAGGVCIGRLRGSHPTSTLIPDVDHAAVGNAFAPFTGGFHIRDPPVFHISQERRKRVPLLWRMEGEPPASCNSAMGSRVPA